MGIKTLSKNYHGRCKGKEKDTKFTGEATKGDRIYIKPTFFNILGSSSNLTVLNALMLNSFIAKATCPCRCKYYAHKNYSQ